MKTKLKHIYSYLGMVLFPIITFYLLEFYTHNPFKDIKFPIQILNIILMELLMLLLFFLFGNIKSALLAESGFFFFAGLINYFVMQFRSIPIMPWDIFSFGTALSVADNYKYHLNTSAVLTILAFLFLLIAEWNCDICLPKNLLKRGGGAIASFICLLLFTAFMHRDQTILDFRIYDKLFTPTVVSKRNGNALAFLMELEYMSVDKPSGYRKEDAYNLLASYRKEETVQSTPNIIVIMNEAFADLNVLGDFETNEDYIPFFHSLMDGAEDTISGYLNVSILGGNTPNTEFEYLTGNSLAFLPQGSIPFQQYIKKAIPSMPSYLKSLGYQTIAMHPYHSGGWDRIKVYPMLGFDTSYFLDDFKDASYIRKYVSDASCYDKIIKEYENKETEAPLFVFNVTMQNHSSYNEDFDNFNPEIEMQGGNSKVLNHYLSLLKVSDDALRSLLTYFDNVNEDTIIVFFGDHQPTNSVVEPIWKAQGKSGSSLTESEEFLRYKVPFFIWSNYDIAEASGLDSSPNYLAAKTLEAANLPLPPYFSFLRELEQSFPSISALHTEDKSGASYMIKDKKNELNTYAQLQYFQLFDYYE